MDVAKILGEIKKLVFGTDVPPPAPEEMAKEYTTTEGVLLTIDKLEVGGAVVLDGASAADGVYTIPEVGAVTVVGGLITVVEAKQLEEMKTAEQFKAALQDFADTPNANPDVQKLATIVRALFERSFGWELREAEEKQKTAEAINAYKTGFEKQTQTLENYKAAMGQLIELVGEFAEQSKETPLEDEKKYEDMTPLERYRAFKKQFQN